MVLFKSEKQVPGDLQSLYNEPQATWAYLGLEQDTDITWLIEQMVRNIFRKYNLEMHLFKAFGI